MELAAGVEQKKDLALWSYEFDGVNGCKWFHLEFLMACESPKIIDGKPFPESQQFSF